MSHNLTQYVVGIVFGSIILIAGISYLMFVYLKSRSLEKVIKEIGTKAEVVINKDVSLWARHTDSKFIKSNLYKFKENTLFEVDSVLITKKTVVVIEIKSISGEIHGDGNNAKWEKRLPAKSFSIKSPIIQNDRHIKHITKILGTKLPIISLIIFSNRVDYLKIENIPNHVVITKHINLYKILDEIDESLEPKITVDNMKMIYHKLKKHITRNSKDIKRHRNITKGKR